MARKNAHTKSPYIRKSIYKHLSRIFVLGLREREMRSNPCIKEAKYLLTPTSLYKGIKYERIKGVTTYE